MKRLLITIILILLGVNSSLLADEFKILANGKEIKFNTPIKITRGEVFISLDDEKALKSISALLGGVYFQSPDGYLICKDQFKSNLSLNLEKIGVQGEYIPNPLIKEDGKVYVPLTLLARSLKAGYHIDKLNKTAYLFPTVTEVYCIKKEKRLEVIVQATAPIEYNTFFLTQPSRLVIDIPNTVVNLTRKEVPKENDLISEIEVSMEEKDPQTTRVILYLASPLIARVSSRIQLDQVRLKLNFPEEETADASSSEEPLPQQTSNFSSLLTQQILGVEFEEKKDVQQISIFSSGPVVYEWNWLEKEQKFYIDIKEAVLPQAKLTRSIENSLIKQIRVAQNQTSPDKVVRVVVELNRPCGIEVKPSSEISNCLILNFYANKQEFENITGSRSGYVGFLLSNKTVVIDPGHGGADFGAINPDLGIAEKTITLDIALKVYELLVKDGWNVILTRNSDRDVVSAKASDSEELGGRVNIANKCNADLFISIHCNASYNRKVSGVSSHYFKEIDLPLAEMLQQSLTQNILWKNRGVQQNRFFVLRYTKMPAVLLELGFISNNTEAKLLKNPEFVSKVAQAIYEGICNYMIKYMPQKVARKVVQ